MRYSYVIGFLAAAFMAAPTDAAAQSDRAISLFECTLNGGANRVGVHVYDDTITYSYANSVGQLELNLNDTVAEVEHVLALWDDPNFTESVTFYSGATSYEVFSEARRDQPIGVKAILDGGPVDGGVVVTTPDGTRTEILCDKGTIEPRNPLMRLARLAPMKSPDYDMLDECSAQIGPRRCAEYALAQCDGMQRDTDTPLNCLSEHLTWSLIELEKTHRDAVSMAQNRGGDLAALQNAQEIWEAGRIADCKIAAWTVYNVMDGDVGAQQCNFDYNIKRIQFLHSYIAGLEFDG